MQLSVMGFLIALAFTLASGAVLIPFLRRLKAGQMVRLDGPRAHLAKSGTPTMGGVTFLLALLVAMVAVGAKGISAYLPLIITMGFGLIGLGDDLLKIALRRPLGLKARFKLASQLAISLALAVGAVAFLGRQPALSLPGGAAIFLGWLYLPFVALVAICTANSVNLTDGLDGLAAGVTFFAALAYVAISLHMGRQELALFAAALAAGCLGFLAYNRHPAQVFMGDTGSLALGGALASLAVLTGTELLLVVIGGIYVLEALSVILQVAVFQITGRRVLRMSPLHHHFELSGWPEGAVVRTFWVASFFLAALGAGLVYGGFW